MARSPRPISARVRILAAVLAVACVGLAVVGSVTFLVQRERLLIDVDERLKAQVTALTVVARDADATDSGSGGGATTATEDLDIARFDSVRAYLRTAVARLVPGRNEASLAIIDGDARYRPTTLSGFDVSTDAAFVETVWSDATVDPDTVMGTTPGDGRMLRYIAIPVEVEGDPEQGLYVRAVDLDAELAPVTAAMATYALAALAVLVAIAVVGWFVAGRLLSPLRQLREAARGVTLTDLSARLPAEGNDDIADLSRTVNSMLERLEGSVDVQRRLLDDVRHELKTPITIVRGHLELMDPADADDIATTRALGIAELDRMTRLVEDIDLLATVEGVPSRMEEVDLAALTARMGELVVVIPGHRWSIETRGTQRVLGDQDRLLQAWIQLADNAAKYTPEGTPIEIGSAGDATSVRLWVRDHGPGIPPAQRRRIFRRFDRAGGKRMVGGSGLGLAIVDAIAKSHGGHCAVTDTPGGGATFTIHIPVAAPDVPAPVRAGDVVLQRERTG